MFVMKNIVRARVRVKTLRARALHNGIYIYTFPPPSSVLSDKKRTARGDEYYEVEDLALVPRKNLISLRLMVSSIVMASKKCDKHTSTIRN